MATWMYVCTGLKIFCVLNTPTNCSLCLLLTVFTYKKKTHVQMWHIWFHKHYKCCARFGIHNEPGIFGHFFLCRRLLLFLLLFSLLCDRIWKFEFDHFIQIDDFGLLWGFWHANEDVQEYPLTMTVKRNKDFDIWNWNIVILIR